MRTPAVAGLFYPAQTQELRSMVRTFLQQVTPTADPVPKAIIAPHAGYLYSGPIAATVYARLIPARDTLQRVVLLGPSHRVPFQGLAATRKDRFSTPLGEVSVDQQVIPDLLQLPQVKWLEIAHEREHSLEVHLPFLQETLKDFTLVPLVVGNSPPQQVGAVLEQLWGGAETLIVISSDLSHYHDYETAQKIDKLTSQAIEDLNFEKIMDHQACGCHPINGLLYIAKIKGLHATTVDLRNSGDTAGPKHQVVGYGAYVFH
jgi:AmmeMemoRadiSam system protein B